MTLSAMVARPTGRNWVRTDRFGEWLKAFLCARPPSITVLLTSITNGWSCGPPTGGRTPRSCPMPELVWVRAGVRRTFSGNRFWHC